MNIRTETSEPATPVVYRCWNDGGAALALFPALPADTEGLYCTSYMHVGQHGAADYHLCIKRTHRPRGEREWDEVRSLIEELMNMGYRLRRYVAAQAWMHETRLEAARKELRSEREKENEGNGS